MASKLSLERCLLLFICITIPFAHALRNAGHSSNEEDLKQILLDATTAVSSVDIVPDETTMDTSVSSNSDNAPKLTLGQHLSGSTNTSQSIMGSIIPARNASVMWKRIHDLLWAKLSGREPGNNTSEFYVNMIQYNSTTTIPERKTAANQSEESNGNENKLHAKGRQFLFHPYLPYGKEIMPDEKISFHDVLPVKMVKFIKGMVEEAPWEQMFMKMVRMVVDQFVDKIIEKMFTHDEGDGGKWRSLDGEFVPTGNSPKHSTTSVERLRRSAVKGKWDKEEDWSNSGFSTENRLSKLDQHKEKGTSEESWLDSVLDYLFPDDSKSDSENETPKTRRKRGIESPEPTENLQMPDILNTFFVKLYELQTGELASEQLKSAMKKVVHNQLLSSVFHYHSMLESNSTDLGVTESSHNSLNTPANLTERWRNILIPQSQVKGGSSVSETVRIKRSAGHSEEKEDSKRLWQANRRSRPMNFKSRGECSLRRACNTGRLLARLPSVKDITLQLKNYGNEPHWDALVWGMAKKKCSKIYCKRQRSPKGSKYRWDTEERRHYRNNISPTRSSRIEYDENDPSIVSSLLF